MAVAASYAVDTWAGCYRAGWPRHQLVPEAFAHPAKFAPGIAFRLIEHALAEGWLSPGDTVADPFGGVALGALPCLLQGLRWIGCELEPHFVDMGQGCACTGFSQANWVRYYGRWSRVSHTHGHHWCPRCLAQAPQGTDDAAPQKRTFRIAPRPGRYDEWALFPHGEQHPVGLLQPRPAPKVPQKTFAFLGLPFPDRPGRQRPPPRAQALFAQQTASYARNSGLIPTTLAHVYEGNRGLWARQGHGQAVLLQGDSRQLCAVLGEQAACIVSSPPYADSLQGSDTRDYPQEKLIMAKAEGRTAPQATWGVNARSIDTLSSKGYGTTPGNLGNLPSGELAAVISSPPYAGTTTVDGRAITDWQTHTRDIGHMADLQHGYGTTPGQLEGLPLGDLAAVISSPPYAGAGEVLGAHNGIDYSKTTGTGQRLTPGRRMQPYGTTPGQLGAMPSGELAAIVTSPPYSTTDTQPTALGNGKGTRAIGDSASRNKGDYHYPDSLGQLGIANPDTFWSAARTILEQCFKLLKAGGEPVPDGKGIEFCSCK